MTSHPRAEAIFAEHGIAVVPAHVMPAVGQTRAIVTLERIINRHGDDHARFVVMTLAETANNKGFIDETSLWVVSDMIRAAEKNFPDLVTNNVTAWFEFFDDLPLGWLQFLTIDLDGVVSKRHALVGMLWERMKRRFGGLYRQPDLLDDRNRRAVSG
ncbi:hypothetical protein AGRHK599_LOCUS1230 [Rhizobium rhizogenes]|uniref:Uncharacterized protein n=1 Tax=Rhizobium rhizogenes TaxID=359 RepID=A0AAN2DCF5_RHIRH|nr:MULTISPECIES: hypothetical protein [Rhizobium/Agrobacterium group]MCZ7443003.1 hypothetical protein [Rhizobium rhizogenes]CAD0211204.1 hypothetical protein AGRHK599_LOCUS1230 [Rhizobium rhizogenes]